MSYEDVEALVGVLKSSPTLTELEVRKGDRVVRLRRAAPVSSEKTPRQTAVTAGINVGTPTREAPLAAAAAVDSAPVTALVSLASAEVLAPPTRITAGLVGIFHPSRSVPVEEGQTVAQGQVLGQIEAMRLMNDVVSTTAGRVLGVLVEEGQPVQYGQPLFEIVAA